MQASYDAIVVGSGFGGGIAACRLAEAGRRVCVLERGRRFGRDDFPGRPDQVGELVWHPAANPGGMFDVRLMRDLVVITAAGVGGGSLVYANVQLRAPASVFDDPRWPAAIDAATLEPWYLRTEDALQPRTTPAEPPLRKVAAFAAAGARAGREATPLPLAVHFGDAREHPFSGAPQEGCQNLARCDIGCPVHAKNTVDITYVARAEAHGATVLPLHEAKRLEPPDRDGGEWSVGFERLDGGGSGAVRAPLVVLAAGTIGSPRLLLTNRRRLPGLSPALGSGFSGNGDALGVAFDPAAPDVRDAQNDIGPVMTSALDLTEERRLILADGGLPPGFGGVLDIARGVEPHPRLAALARPRAGAAHARGLDGPVAAPGRAARRRRAPHGVQPRRAHLPHDRPRRRGRADAADAAAAPLRRPLEQGGQRRAVRRPGAHRPRARGGGAGDAVLRDGGRAAGQVHDRPPARRLPDGRRPRDERRRRRRPRARPWAASSSSTGRSSPRRSV